MATRLEWATAILKALGVTPYLDGQVALVNVFVAEGSRAEDNPSDVTGPDLPGATPYNTFDGSLHVWNYPTMQEGITAVVDVFNNGLNGDVLAALHAGEDAEHVTAAITSHSSWDSAGTLYMRTLPTTQGNFTELAAVEVPGPPPKEPPVTTPPPTDIPMEPPTDEQNKVEDAVAAYAKAVDAAAVSGKVAALRAAVTDLKTLLSELEDLVK